MLKVLSHSWPLLMGIEPYEGPYGVVSFFAGQSAAMMKTDPVIEDAQTPPDNQCIDFLFFVHDRHDGNLESAKRYLEWEQGLMAQLDDDERAVFRMPSERNVAQQTFTQKP